VRERSRGPIARPCAGVLPRPECNDTMNRIRFRIPTLATGRRDPRRARPLGWTVPLEALEARRLMTATYTDVSQIAALTAPHVGPTNLYINFDGGKVPIDPVNNPNGTSVTIRPFEGEAGDTSLNRDSDIQQVLFEVSEDFAPFNVQVHRIYGAGNIGKGNGDSTICVGGNQANSTTTNTKGHFSFTKYPHGVTYSSSSDYPVGYRTINSDRYDVAFVDPVVGMSTNPSTY
jgi:hypothetical protein